MKRTYSKANVIKRTRALKKAGYSPQKASRMATDEALGLRTTGQYGAKKKTPVRRKKKPGPIKRLVKFIKGDYTK